MTILVFRQFLPRVPGVLVAVVGSIVLSAVLDLAARGVDVLGPLPQGLPGIALPPIDPATIGALLPAAAGIALVTAADVSVLSRTYAARGGYRVDPDQELIALGAANASAGVFSGFPISASASRTPVAEAAGAKSQITGVVGALAIVALLVFLPGLLADLPMPILAAVVIAAATSLMDLGSYRRLWAARRSEFALSLASFAGVAILGVLQGIFLAVLLSLAVFVRRAWGPHDAILARADNVKGYHDIEYYPEARTIPGLLLYRFDAPLFFANAGTFRDRILELVAAADPPVRWVIVAAEPITDIDVTAADVLVELKAELEAGGVILAFAELKDFVKDRLRGDGTLERLEPFRAYPTLGTAVDAYLRATGAEWLDWEEQPDEQPDEQRDEQPGEPPA